MRAILLCGVAILAFGLGLNWYMRSGAMADIMQVAEMHKGSPSKTLPTIKKHVPACMKQVMGDDANNKVLDAYAIDVTYKMVLARAKLGPNASQDEMFGAMMDGAMNGENIDPETVDLVMNPQQAFEPGLQQAMQKYLAAESAIVGCVIGKIVQSAKPA